MTASINQCLTVILEYIDLSWQGTANFWLGLLLAVPLKRGTQLIFKVTCVTTLVNWNAVNSTLIETYYRFVFTSAHYPFPLTKQISSKLLPKIIYSQVHMDFTIDNIVSMVTYPIRRNKLLKMHDRQSQK